MSFTLLQSFTLLYCKNKCVRVSNTPGCRTGQLGSSQSHASWQSVVRFAKLFNKSWCWFFSPPLFYRLPSMKRYYCCCSKLPSGLDLSSPHVCVCVRKSGQMARECVTHAPQQVKVAQCTFFSLAHSELLCNNVQDCNFFLPSSMQKYVPRSYKETFFGLWP